MMMEELDSISILKSYVESIDELAKGDMQLAQELSYWIIQYGIKGIEPPENSNPFMMSPFKQIKKALDKGRNKGKCAKIKSNENQNEIKGNQIEIKSESNGDKNKNKNKNKKENKKVKDKDNTNISISKDIETEIKISDKPKNGYGDEFINQLIILIKDKCNEIGVAYDKQKERQYGKLILTGKDFGEFCEKIGQTREEFAINILIASAKIGFWKGICSGPMKIYLNYAEVYNETIKQHSKNQKNLIQSF